MFMFKYVQIKMAAVQPTPYFRDVTDREFTSFVPPRIRIGDRLPAWKELSRVFPERVIGAKCERLTQAINDAAMQPQAPGPVPRNKYSLVRTVPLRVLLARVSYEHDGDGFPRYREFRGGNPRYVVVSEAEAWYHRSGCSHGKVLVLQVVFDPLRPALVMHSARVERNEPEDRMLLSMPWQLQVPGQSLGPQETPRSQIEAHGADGALYSSYGRPGGSAALGGAIRSVPCTLGSLRW